jgi:hypothetical protein
MGKAAEGVAALNEELAKLDEQIEFLNRQGSNRSVFIRDEDFDALLKQRAAKAAELNALVERIAAPAASLKVFDPLHSVQISQAAAAAEAGTVSLKDYATAADEVSEAVLRQQQTVRDLISDLEFEARIRGMTIEQQQIETNLRNAGSIATEAQRTKIAALTTEMVRFEAAQAAATFTADSLFDRFFAYATKTEKLSESLKKLALSFAEAAARALLLGQGPLAGLFGGGQGALTSIVGSVFGVGGAATGGGGGGVPLPVPRPGARATALNFAPVTQIDARGSGRGAAEEIKAELDRRDEAIMANVQRGLPQMLRQSVIERR